MTTTPQAPAKTTTAAVDDDYQTVARLIAEHAEASLLLSQMQQVIDTNLLATASAIRPEHITLQSQIALVEDRLETLVRRHPEWFLKRKSLVTPCGTVKLTSTSKLEAQNDELSVALIERYYPEIGELYLRRSTELNLEALAALSDAELERLKIRRVQGENFTVTPAKVNLGKAVAAAAEKEAK